MAQLAIAAAVEAAPEIEEGAALAYKAGARKVVAGIGTGYTAWDAFHEKLDHAKETWHHAYEDYEGAKRRIESVYEGGQRTLDQFFSPQKKRNKTTMSTGERAASSSSHIPGTRSSGPMDTDEKQARKQASVAAKGAKFTTKQPRAAVGRLCWHPSCPFPPVLSTTLENEVEYELDWAWNAGAGTSQKPVVAGVNNTGTLVEQGGIVFCAQPNILNLQGLFASVTNGDIDGEFNFLPAVYNGESLNQVNRSPYARHFLDMYRSAIVTGARFTFSIARMTDSGTVDNMLMTKRYLVDNHDEMGVTAASDDWWPLQTARGGLPPGYGGNSAHGFINMENHGLFNKGDWLARGKVFEDGIRFHRLPARNENYPNAGAKITQSWSLLGDEKVDPYEIIAGYQANNPFRDEHDTDPARNERWSYERPAIENHMVETAPADSIETPSARARPKFYYVLTHDLKDTASGMTTHRMINGTDASASQSFKIRFKIQQDVLFWDFSKASQVYRKEDTS